MEFGKRHDNAQTFVHANLLETCCRLVTRKLPTCYGLAMECNGFWCVLLTAPSPWPLS